MADWEPVEDTGFTRRAAKQKAQRKDATPPLPAAGMGVLGGLLGTDRGLSVMDPGYDTESAFRPAGEIAGIMLDSPVTPGGLASVGKAALAGGKAAGRTLGPRAADVIEEMMRRQGMVLEAAPRAGADRLDISKLFGAQPKDVQERIVEELLARDAAKGKEWRREVQNPNRPSSVNDAGLSRREYDRLKDLDYDVRGGVKASEPGVGINDLKRDFGSLVMVPGDQSRAGATLHRAGDTTIKGGSQIYGGPLWSLWQQEKGRPAAWASRDGATATAFQGKVHGAAQATGDDRVLGMYATMDPVSHGFTVHTKDALLRATNPSSFSDDAVRLFNDRMRSLKDAKGTVLYPDFPGVENNKALRAALAKSSDMRQAFYDTMMTPKYSAGLGVDGPAIRRAITEPELADQGAGMMGFSTMKMDPSTKVPRKMQDPSDHTTYNAEFPGSYNGRMLLELPWQWYMPDVARAIDANPRQAKYAWGTAKSLNTYQPITQEMVDYIAPIEEMYRKARGFAEGGLAMAGGGLVGKATKAAAEAGSKRAGTEAAGVIDDWKWLPADDVRAKLGMKEVPDYIQGGYGQFMKEQADRAAAGDMGARDLIKAYAITRSSVNRGGLPFDSATKGGLKIPYTTELVRPEGAMAELLLTKPGQRYLNAAERGAVDEGAIGDMTKRFAPFGMADTLGKDLVWAVENLPQKGVTLNEMVRAPIDEYRPWAKEMRGIGPSKNGFIASMVGRGDIPTFDARQIRLHTGAGGKDASKYLSRRGGAGGDAAVDRLADRQGYFDFALSKELSPFYQHLSHHAVWDKVGGSATTHEDIIRAMRAAGVGGVGVGAAALSGGEQDAH